MDKVEGDEAEELRLALAVPEEPDALEARRADEQRVLAVPPPRSCTVDASVTVKVLDAEG